MMNPTTASAFIPKAAKRQPSGSQQPNAKTLEGKPKQQLSPLALALLAGGSKSGHVKFDASKSPPVPVPYFYTIPIGKRLLIVGGLILLACIAEKCKR